MLVMMVMFVFMATAFAFTMFMIMFVMMFAAFAMVFAFAAAIMIFATAAAVSAATTLMRKLRINNQRSKHNRANVVKHAKRTMTMTFCRTMRKHRSKERIHQERVHNKAKEHRS